MTSSETSRTTPSEATHAAEDAEARATHTADRPPTAEEEKAAPDHVDPEVAKDYKEMAEKGANVKGEGQLP